jgi:nucleotide-binding universal stress UspA family protein
MRPDPSYPTIGVGYDGSAAARAAVEHAIDRAITGGNLVLVHAYQVPADHELGFDRGPERGTPPGSGCRPCAPATNSVLPGPAEARPSSAIGVSPVMSTACMTSSSLSSIAGITPAATAMA